MQVATKLKKSYTFTVGGSQFTWNETSLYSGTHTRATTKNSIKTTILNSMVDESITIHPINNNSFIIISNRLMELVDLDHEDTALLPLFSNTGCHYKWIMSLFKQNTTIIPKLPINIENSTVMMGDCGLYFRVLFQTNSTYTDSNIMGIIRDSRSGNYIFVSLERDILITDSSLNIIKYIRH